MTKIYISGPMTGKPDLNFPAFNEAARLLEAAGYEVVDPATFEVNIGKSWTECLRHDLSELLKCDAVAVLPDWQESRGANLEVYNAVQLEMTIDTVEGWVTKALGRPMVWTTGVDAA